MTPLPELRVYDNLGDVVSGSCRVLQCVAVCCSVLQCVAVCCSVCCIFVVNGQPIDTPAGTRVYDNIGNVV